MFNVDQLRLRVDALMRAHPELTEDEELRFDMLEGELDLDHVLTTLFEGLKDSEDKVAALAQRKAELSARKQRFERRVELARLVMLDVLQSADLKKVELAEFTVSQRAGTPQVIGEPDVNALPDDLVRIKREPDAAAIRQALLNHREIPGLALSNAPPTLTIRTR
jgi:Gp157 protein